MTTEQLIKKAAMEVFLRDGLEGARMQDIADTAGVNKAMLHYYFSSKEVMFDTVFSEIILELIPKVDSILSSNVNFIDKLKSFIKVQVEEHRLSKCPLAFVVTEVSKNPERMNAHIKALEPFKQYIATFMTQYSAEVNEGKLVSYSPMHLFLMINSLIDHYYMTKPFFKGMLNTEHYQLDDNFEDQLTIEVGKFIENALLIK